MAPTRILIVDSDISQTNDVDKTLRSGGFEIVRLKNSEQLINVARTQGIQLILLTCSRQEFSGLDLCRKLRAARMLQPILLLGRSSESHELISGLEAGADDFMLVPFFPQELLARTRALLRRSVPSTTVVPMRFILQLETLEVDFDRLRASRGGVTIDVTPTEFRILRYLVEHRNKACSRQQLANAIYTDTNNAARDRTIDVHIRRLREKLEDDPGSPRWFLTIRGAGYMFHE